MPYTDQALALLLIVGGIPFVWAVASGLGAYFHALAEKTRSPAAAQRQTVENDDDNDDDNRWTL